MTHIISHGNRANFGHRGGVWFFAVTVPCWSRTSGTEEETGSPHQQTKEVSNVGTNWSQLVPHATSPATATTLLFLDISYNLSLDGKKDELFSDVDVHYLFSVVAEEPLHSR